MAIGLENRGPEPDGSGQRRLLAAALPQKTRSGLRSASQKATECHAILENGPPRQVSLTQLRARTAYSSERFSVPIWAVGKNPIGRCRVAREAAKHAQAVHRSTEAPARRAALLEPCVRGRLGTEAGSGCRAAGERQRRQRSATAGESRAVPGAWRAE